jgi:hypothetical protein
MVTDSSTSTSTSTGTGDSDSDIELSTMPSSMQVVGLGLGGGLVERKGTSESQNTKNIGASRATVAVMGTRSRAKRVRRNNHNFAVSRWVVGQ